MKILLIGEYSNVHNTLAEGLRALGHDVTVMSDGDSWKNYHRDIDVTRKPGKIGGLCLLSRIWTLLPRMKGYDVVQLINPIFFELRAERLFFFFNFLRHHNKCIILGAFGIDYYWVHACTFEKPLRYSDFNFGKQVRKDKAAIQEQQEWLNTSKERLNKLIANLCDGIVTGLYEYHICYHPKFPDKTRFIPMPIRMVSQPMPETTPPEVIKFFIGISKNRSAYKGTDIMLQAAQDVNRKYHEKTKLNIAEGVPFDQYERMMNHSDALLDQLYSYTPAMNSLLAMSKGIINIGGGEPENYEILNEKELKPIINVLPTYESVYHELEELVVHPERIPELKQQSIKYVERHHDYIKVARHYEEFYLERISRKTSSNCRPTTSGEAI